MSQNTKSKTPRIRKSKQPNNDQINAIMFEGVISEAISQTKSALDILFYGESNLEPHKVVLGVAGIASHESSNILNFVKDNTHTIKSKHKAVVSISVVFNKEINKMYMDLKNATDESDPQVITAAKLITHYLETLHIVMHHDTKFKERREKETLFNDTWK